MEIKFFLKKKLWVAATAIVTTITSFLVFAAANFKDEIISFLDLSRASIEISTSNNMVELHKKVPIDVRIDSLGVIDLLPGTLYLVADPKFISIKPKANVKIGAVSGSQPVDSLPELTIVKMPMERLKISANYISGALKVKSNDIFIDVAPPKKVIQPHFDISDTGRVNLSGKWDVEVGGVPGTMMLQQGTDNKISGTYSIPGGKWSSGEISGQKDGKTFRVRFSIPGREQETIRVAGYFEIQSKNGAFIEIEGCAYHLQKSDDTYDVVGIEGVDCNKKVNYDYWKVIQTANFYAYSPFDLQEQ